MNTHDPFAQELLKRGIAPSHQRVMILKYLSENQTHPTADQIFSDLRGDIATLSKATVYNTLNAFIEAKLVRTLSIDENETRYDIVMENHGHFKCLECGAIYNFAVDIDRFVTGDLKGYMISEKHVYFNGVCPTCLAKNST